MIRGSVAGTAVARPERYIQRITAGKEGIIDYDYLLRTLAEDFEKAPVTFPITLVVKGTVWEGIVIPKGEFMRIQAATLARMTGDEKSEEVAESHAGTFREIGIPCATPRQRPM